MIDNNKRLKSEVKQWSDKKNIRKTKSLKMTPCKAIKILLNANPIKQCNDVLALASMRSDHKTSSTAIFQRIVFLLKENPNIIKLVNPTDGYNALHHVCSNPTLVMNIKAVKALVNASENFIKETNDDEEMIAENDDIPFKETCIAQILRQKTSVYGDLPLHLLCKNSSLASLDVFEYLVQAYPQAACVQDKLSLNLPLHNICKACNEEPIHLEFVLLLVQSWPKSCQVRNRDGNLPIHLAATIVKHRSRENLPNMFGSDGNESEFDIFDENEFSMKTESMTSVLSCENNQTSEDYELLRFEKQLDILQYLVSLYPEGLDAKNNQGLTPLEMALLTSSDSFSFPESINDRWERKTSDSKSKHKLIIDFLRQQDTSCSETVSLSTNNGSITSHQKKGSIFDNLHNSGIIDTSGHEYDEDEHFDDTKWVDRGYEEASPDDRRAGLSGSGHQRESMAKRQNSTDMFVVNDQDNGLGSSSYHCGVSTNTPSNKIGRRGSIGKNTESDKRSALTSSSYHRESKPRLLGTTMGRRGSVEHYCPFNTWSETCTKVASSDWQNNEDDDNLSCAMQALDEFSEQEAGPDDRRARLSGSGYQHEGMAKRRNSTDMFVVNDQDNGLGSSSYHCGVSTNTPSNKIGRRGSIGRSTESDKRSALTSTSYHRESKPRLLGTKMGRRGSVEQYCPFNTWSETCTKMASSDWQNNEDDDNLSCAMQALDEFSEHDDSIEKDRVENHRVLNKHDDRRRGLRKQKNQESQRSVSSTKSIVRVGSWLAFSEGDSSRNLHNHVGEC